MRVTPKEFAAIRAEMRLAKIWQQRGRTARALEGFRRVLRAQPDHELAQLHLAEILAEQQLSAEAIAVYKDALEHHPNQPRLHKGLVSTLAARDDWEAVFAYYALTRADERTMDWQPGDVMCCTVVQNEAQRLPFFLTYYRERGIAKFFFIDNDSTDGTLAFLLEQPDVYVWHSPLSFRRANYGSAWFEVLLRRYGQQHWWLMVDADELFVYPACETKTLPQLSCELERRGKKAFNAVLLDMYADVPVRDTTYCAGQSFLDACPFFDRAFYHRQFAEAGPFRNQTGFRGGARERVFGGETFYLSKVPLLFYEPGVLLAGGQHWTNHPKSVIAGARGALLHFKFFSTFHAHVAQEVAHRQHAREAYEYHNYARRLQQDPALTLYHPAHSVKYENSAQLVRLGIMQDEPE